MACAGLQSTCAIKTYSCPPHTHIQFTVLITPGHHSRMPAMCHNMFCLSFGSPPPPFKRSFEEHRVKRLMSAPMPVLRGEFLLSPTLTLLPCDAALRSTASSAS